MADQVFERRLPSAVVAWRKRHKRCRFCKHYSCRKIESGLDTVSMCKAKDIGLGPYSCRPFCSLYEVKEYE